MTYKGLNAAYKAYKSDPSEVNLTQLLESARRRVMYRLVKDEQDADDIAQNVLIKLWIALVKGKFDPQRGDMSTYVAATARTARIDFHKRDRMMPLQDEVLERFLQDSGYRPADATDPIDFEDGK